ncbi:MAG: hypothetical protein IAE90_10315 [Ignavibacteria bacterium]|nr:hypothetical protein [Ignavibacteria bacterium]
MKLLLIICAFLFCISANAQYISYGKIEPIDESGSDPSFKVFVEELKQTVRNKDAAALYNVLDDSIQFSFGDEIQSKSEFRKAWDIDNPNSEFWEAFGSTIDLGIVRCATDCDYSDFVFPYYQESGLLKDVNDAYSVLIIITPDARIYSAPAKNSRVLTTLSYEAISLVDFKDDWFVISFNSKTRGYINKLDARSLVGLRGGFKKKNGEWKLVYFISGD